MRLRTRRKSRSKRIIQVFAAVLLDIILALSVVAGDYIYNYKIINRFNGQNTNLDFYESLIESFEHMKQYQTFLKQACLMDGQNCLKEYIPKHCEEFDLKWHQQLYGEKLMPDALKFATIYHANASSAMTLSWILSDMKVPVEEMAKMITQMRGLGMDDLFQGSDCTTNPYKIDK